MAEGTAISADAHGYVNALADPGAGRPLLLPNSVCLEQKSRTAPPLRRVADVARVSSGGEAMSRCGGCQHSFLGSAPPSSWLLDLALTESRVTVTVAEVVCCPLTTCRAWQATGHGGNAPRAGRSLAWPPARRADSSRIARQLQRFGTLKAGVPVSCHTERDKPEDEFMRVGILIRRRADREACSSHCVRAQCSAQRRCPRR